MTTLAIEKLMEEWDRRVESAANKGQKLFGDMTEYNALVKIINNLKLDRAMGISDLISALSFLENIAVKTQSKPEYITLGESLRNNKFSTLNSYDISPKKEELGISTELNSSFYNFLVKNHNILLQHYEQAYFHALGEIPVSEVNYDADQLQESQAFYDLETTTSSPNLKNNDTIVSDMARGGVTINGQKIKPIDSDDNYDPKILDAIQTLTKDSPKDPFSKGYQILTFGGQFLEAILLEEFKNSTIYIGTGNGDLDPGLNKGQIDWYSENSSNETNYYANIDMKILTCSSTTSDKYFAIAADGSSLLKMDSSQIDGVMLRSGQEVSGFTTGNVVPICQIKAKVKIEDSPNGYMLKVIEYKTQYNTPDLESSKTHLTSVIRPK